MKRRRRSLAISLVLVPALLAAAGCSYDPSGDEEAVQRDVYTKFEDCVADWGKPEFCQQIADAEAKQFAQSAGVSGTGSGGPVIFWGPNYYPYAGGRSVIYNGNTFTPSTNMAMSRPFVVTPSSSTIARSSPASPARSSSFGSASRGGFGAAGHAAGGGSGG